MKKGFTLIELIVVIAVLAILAAIVIPNISNVKNKATVAAVTSNIRNLQTAVDMFHLEQINTYPTLDSPKEFIPQPIDFSKIQPEYLRNLPKTIGVKYWVDYTGKVWGSTVDAPKDVTINLTTGSVAWSPVNGATAYHVFEIQGYKGVIGALFSSNEKLVLVATVTDSSFKGEAGKAYVISSIDKEGFQTAPSGIGYTGYQEPEETVAKPIAIIGMNPEQDIFTNTTVSWNYTQATIPTGETIADAEWQLDSGAITKTPPETISSVGSHTMKLRIQTSNGVWSDWTSKTFVVKEIVYSEIQHTHGVQLNGTNAFIQIGDIGAFPTQGTIEFWMKADVVENYRNPFSTSSGNIGIRFEEASVGSFDGVVGSDSGVYTASNYMKTGMEANKWYHVALVWDVVTKNVKTYLNGQLTSENTNQLYFPTRLSDVKVGKGYNEGRYWKGKVDNLRIWKVARSEDEILNNKSKSLVGDEAGLLGYWKLDETSGTVAKDSSPNKHDGTVYNGSFN